MSVADLIRELQAYPPDSPVTSATVRIRTGNLFSTLKVSKPRPECGA